MCAFTRDFAEIRKRVPLVLDFPVDVEGTIERCIKCKEICNALKSSPEALIYYSGQRLAFDILPHSRSLRIQQELFGRVTLSFSNPRTYTLASC
jgi:hypothetical protein